MEYYGSDKARLDFLNKKEAPPELLGQNGSSKSYMNNQRNASVLDHLFDGQKKANPKAVKLKIGECTKIISEMPNLTNEITENS